jgi:hypothetical protein
MPPKKTARSRAQSPSATQKALLAEQKRLAKASWKETATATECDRQRGLVRQLLKLSHEVQIAICAYELTDTEADAELEQSLKLAADTAEEVFQQQALYGAVHVKKGKQLRALQLAFEKVNFQMTMVCREHASNVADLKKLEARIQDCKVTVPRPEEELVTMERRREETLAIIAFKIRAMDLLMTGACIEDKEFVCQIGTAPPMSTTEVLPASGSQPAPDADMNADDESDQESLDNSAVASDHMSVDGDNDENSPGDISPSKRAKVAPSTSYAEFVSGAASRNEISARSQSAAGPRKMFGRDVIGNGYDILREHAALVVPDTRYPESRFLDRISVEKVLHNMIVPVLHFTGNGSVISFKTLHHSASAVYAVIADCCDSVTNMRLIYRDPAFATRYFPQCISFEHGIYSPLSYILNWHCERVCWRAKYKMH